MTCTFSANGYRLPSEAEWEYAARGGKQSKGYKYSGSNNADEVAWHTDNSGKTTHPVGQKKANELALYDMNGNVWEWCWDWKGSYSSVSQSNPKGQSSGSDSVVRGGRWDSDASGVRIANRGSGSPSYSGYVIGFRLCRTE